MTKSIRVSESLYTLADKEATIMHRSTAGQLEFWASIGRKAEALLENEVLQVLLQASLVDDAQSSSQFNNQKLSMKILEGKLSAESLRFFNQSLVRKSVADFSGTDF